MAETRPPTLVPILWFVAAALALAAVVITFARTSEVRWFPLGAAAALTVLGVLSLKKARTG